MTAWDAGKTGVGGSIMMDQWHEEGLKETGKWGALVNSTGVDHG